MLQRDENAVIKRVEYVADEDGDLRRVENIESLAESSERMLAADEDALSKASTLDMDMLRGFRDGWAERLASERGPNSIRCALRNSATSRKGKQVVRTGCVSYPRGRCDCRVPPSCGRSS